MVTPNYPEEMFLEPLGEVEVIHHKYFVTLGKGDELIKEYHNHKDFQLVIGKEVFSDFSSSVSIRLVGDFISTGVGDGKD